VPDESDLVDYLALSYSQSGSFLDTPGLMTGSYVVDGTVNGGDWYVAYGTMQDWSYVESGCIDYTVEISTARPETESEMNDLFAYNRDSILAYIGASGTGVFGKVVNSSDEPVNAMITIDGGDIETLSDDYGYYHKILTTGTYTIRFNAAGFSEYSQAVNIVDTSIPVELNVTMIP
jgi:hypothetical protein